MINVTCNYKYISSHNCKNTVLARDYDPINVTFSLKSMSNQVTECEYQNTKQQYRPK